MVITSLKKKKRKGFPRKTEQITRDEYRKVASDPIRIGIPDMHQANRLESRTSVSLIPTNYIHQKINQEPIGSESNLKNNCFFRHRTNTSLKQEESYPYPVARSKVHMNKLA